MKKITNLLTAFVLLITQNIFSQTVVFSENMGDAAVGASQLSARTYTGYQNYNSSSITFDASTSGSSTIRDNNTNNSSGYTGASAGNYLYQTGNSSSFFQISNINVSGIAGLQLSFGASKTGVSENGSSLLVEIMIDGNTQSFSPTLATGAGTTQWYYVTVPVTLQGSSLSLRFSNSSTSTNNVSFRIDDILLTATQSLPVSFSNITAVKSNDKVTVNWVTESETNNSHFEIEASKNGVDFTTVKTINTQNGNSATSQYYNAVIEISEVASLFSIPVLLAFLSAGFVRKKYWYIHLFIATAVCAQITSCSKSTINVEMNDSEKLFIRIKQVDVDKTFKYSKIVQVVNE